MKKTGRIIVSLVLFFIVFIWHLSYFVIDSKESQHFFFTNGFIVYDFIYTPLLAPVIWWLGKQYDKSRYYSNHDILTGDYNRRYVLSLFPKIAALTSRNGLKLSISVIDVNNFKRINDTYGHAVGDKVLQHISNVLTESTRRSDIVSRWGGDEFLIIAQHNGREGMGALNQRLQESNISLIDDVEISVSVGTALYPDDGEQLDELFKKADHNMYALKKKRKPV